MLDIHQETCTLGYEPVAFINSNVKLIPDQGEFILNPGQLRRLFGKLNFLLLALVLLLQ